MSIKGGFLCSIHMQIEMRFSRLLNGYLVGVRRLNVVYFFYGNIQLRETCKGFRATTYGFHPGSTAVICLELNASCNVPLLILVTEVYESHVGRPVGLIGV